MDLFLESHGELPGEIVLDLDSTDDPIHGHQEGRFFHGCYDHPCFLPPFIIFSEHILCCRLRSADRSAAGGSVDELSRIVAQIRGAWPSIRIMARGDSDFDKDEIMVWCESHDVDHVFGCRQNLRLNALIARELEGSKQRCLESGKASRRYRDLRYRTRSSWSRVRRAMAKAEWLPGLRGRNVCQVVTIISRKTVRAQELYEQRYCAPGAPWITGSRISSCG